MVSLIHKYIKLQISPKTKEKFKIDEITQKRGQGKIIHEKTR
jgi:hypothetical protein